MTQGTLGSRWQLLLLVSMLAAVMLVYWPGIHGGFIFDDFPNIVDNKALRVTRLVWSDWIATVLSSPAAAAQRPLAMLTFAINHYFTGLDPVPMKLTNVAIHMLNTLLVFGLARSLLGAAASNQAGERLRTEWTALFMAACWALHPINLMAVLFVVQRMESMSHTFVFAGLWLYVVGRSRQQAGGSGWGLILCSLLPFTTLGLLVKESAALTPLYAFCIELCVFRFRGPNRPFDRRLAAMYVALLALPAVVGAAWLLSRSLEPGAYSSRAFSLTERLLTEPRVVLDYLRWILWPDLGQLSLYHDDYPISRGFWNPPATLLGWIAMPTLLGIAWLCRHRRPLISLGLLWFLGAQLLTATFVSLELVFEHRNYFASLGICLVLADLLLRAPSRPEPRTAGAALACAFVLVCAGLTLLRAREWRDPVSIAIAEAAKHPQSPRATYYLGWMLAEATGYKSDSPLILPAFQALDRARRVPNSTLLPDHAALILAARTGAPLQAAWWDHMQTRLREHPIGPQELGGLGRLVSCMLERLCQFPQSDVLATFGAALSQGDQPEVLHIYGNYALNELHDTDLALRLWREAHALNPKEPQYQISVIKLLIALGEYDEAHSQITKLRRMGHFGQYGGVADSLEARLQATANHIPVN
jgi:tetratricopeptide (TPR) repeat protein